MEHIFVSEVNYNYFFVSNCIHTVEHSRIGVSGAHEIVNLDPFLLL